MVREWAYVASRPESWEGSDACAPAGPAGASLIVPLSEHISGWMYEVVAHELCDVIVAVREFRHDPCRMEDDGKIRVRRIGAQDPHYP